MNNVVTGIVCGLAALIVMGALFASYWGGQNAIIESCAKHGVYATPDVGMVCQVKPRGERV